MKKTKYIGMLALVSLLNFSPMKSYAETTKEIIIDKSDRKLYVYEDKNLTKEFLVGIGRTEYETPTGDFKIRDKQKNPVWIPPRKPWAKKAREHLNKEGVIPYGNSWNPLKYYYIKVGDGFGIHGYANDKGIGEKSSHGCIRAKKECLDYIVKEIPIGTKVKIQE
jgi:L,D-transpeptidase ErfK/SrfK